MSIWDTVIEQGVKAAGAYLTASGDSGGDSKTTHITPVQPSTEGTATISDFDILYNANAIEGMYNLTNQLSEWSTQDRDFFQSVYQPYQESIVGTNTALLPTIERVAGRTLEANARDMVSNENLKQMFRGSIGGVNVHTEGAMANLRNELANVPTTEERVGQALTSVEKQFSEAGKQLTADFASRGQAVTQASKRDLAFQKATAKAGAAGAAAEAARGERLRAAQAGVGAELQKTESDVRTRQQETASLVALQNAQQAGLALPQVGGVQQTTGFEGAGVTAGLTQAGAEQSFGTRQKQDAVTQVQQGVKAPALTAGATGEAPVEGGAGVQGTAARDESGALITAGSAGATMNAGRPLIQSSTGAMAGVIKSMFGGTSPR